MIVWVKFLPPCDVTGEQLLHYAPFLFTSKKGGKKKQIAPLGRTSIVIIIITHLSTLSLTCIVNRAT